jgi:hypothetical protein
MNDFDKRSHNVRAIQGAGSSCGDFADQDTVSHKVRQETSTIGWSKSLRVKLLTASRWPDCHILRETAHDQNLPQGNQESAPDEAYWPAEGEDVIASNASDFKNLSNTS